MSEQDPDAVWINSGKQRLALIERKKQITAMAQNIMVIQLASDLSNPKVEQAQHRHAVKAFKMAVEAFELIEQQADLFFEKALKNA